jgi:hypothetical protein
MEPNVQRGYGTSPSKYWYVVVYGSRKLDYEES